MKTAGTNPSRIGRGKRLRAFLVLAVATSLVVPVAISWACGPNRAIQLDRITYDPGQTVNVTGANFDAGAAVTIKVNGSPAVQVTVNSTGNINASFSAPSTPGTHVVTTDGVDANGQALAGTGNSVTLTVAAPRPAAGGGSSGGGSTPGTTPQRPGVAAPAPGRTSGGATGRGRGDNSRSVSGGERLRRAAAGRAPANAGINTTEGVITTRGGATSFAGSVPRSTRVAVAARAAGRDAKRGGGAKAAAGRPSERSASADLWSGLASSKNPSLLPGSGSASSTGGAGSGLTLALALLGAGALGLVGLGVAEAKRRRKATAGRY
jgi:hypothetical protein